MPEVRSGAVTIKIINNTNITSTKGVTFISDIVLLFLNFFSSFIHQKIFEMITKISSEKTSNLLLRISNMLLNLLKKSGWYCGN